MSNYNVRRKALDLSSQIRSSIGENVLLRVFRSLPQLVSADSPIVDKDGPASPTFPIDSFFTEWFRNNGRLYYFLFKKNYRVTNIQVAELVALLRSYRSDSFNEFQFVSVQEFKVAISRIVDSFAYTDAKGKSRYKFIADHYLRELHNTVAIDVMYGSCVVYLPPGVDIDLEAVCSRSGYIHSCGSCVYIRNIYKGTRDEMFHYIGDFLDSIDKRILFRPYSHEDFTPFDRKIQADLRSGLDDVKIYTQKYFLGDRRLSEVIEEMRAAFQDKLVIPRPGDYHNDYSLLQNERAKGNFDPRHCLFLVMDHSVDKERMARGDRHFVICYDQRYVNENPFHMFDENKPAWADHTTLPHTLAGAMINITRPFWPKTGKVAVCDCFVGSGTTLLEASMHDDTICFGVDIDPISRQLLKDNLIFFAADTTELKRYDVGISRVLSYLATPDRSPAFENSWDESEEGKAYFSSQKLFEQWSRRKDSVPAFSKQSVAALSRSEMLCRLLFYARIKAERRNQAAIAAGSISPATALRNELIEFATELMQLMGLRDRTVATGVQEGRRVTYQGTYSQALSIAQQYLANLARRMPTSITVKDCREWRPRQLFDVVVTDPPYGFNTNEEKQLLAHIYSSVLLKSIGSLKNGGQLVIALPDWSHTGRQIPAFALKDFVIQQVLIVAEQLRKEVIHSGIRLPKALGGPPFYWESEKALRRAILHFRFRENAGYRRRPSRVQVA